MFKIKQNELIDRMKCTYEDENGNTAVLFRQPEYNKIKIAFKSPKDVTFNKLEINVADPGDGCDFRYSYNKNDETITQEYINRSIKNIMDFVNYALGLDNAIRLLGADPRMMAGYLALKADSEEEKQTAVSKAKYNLILQYPELKELFADFAKAPL